MAKKLYEETNIQDIANAIRAKNGSQDSYTVEEMGDAIRDISIETVDMSGGSGDYDLLEYIDSDGTQAIDTGIKTKKNDILAVRALALSGNNDYHWVVSSWYSSTRYAGTIYSAGVTRAYDGNGNNMVLYNGVDTTDSHVYSIICNNTSQSAVNAHVFALKDGSDILQNFSKVRLFYVVVGEVLLVPARRKSDNACGLLDITNNNFLTDIANGNAFGAGPVMVNVSGSQPNVWNWKRYRQLAQAYNGGSISFVSDNSFELTGNGGDVYTIPNGLTNNSRDAQYPAVKGQVFVLRWDVDPEYASSESHVYIFEGTSTTNMSYTNYGTGELRHTVVGSTPLLSFRFGNSMDGVALKYYNCRFYIEE